MNDTNETTVSPSTDPPTKPPVYYGPYRVTFELDFPDEDCFMKIAMNLNGTNETILVYNVPDPAEQTVQLQDDITHNVHYSVQDVMETVVDKDISLAFTVTYTGSETGYFVKGIRKLRSNADCMWFLYYQAPEVPYPFFQSKGVSIFSAEPNSTVVMRYQYPPVHYVFYEIYFPHVNCTEYDLPRPDPLKISLYFGAPNYTYSVQTVMELAVDMDRSYEFTVTYFGKKRGYELDAINGTENHEDCKWHFYYLPPRVAREKATQSYNITYFNVEADSTIIMSFQELEKLKTPPTPSSSASPVSSSPAGTDPSPTPTPPPIVETPTLPMPTSQGGATPLTLAGGRLMLAVLSIAACLTYTYIL